MSASRFQLLLERLPQVAEVINRFQSVELQRDVLQAVLKAFDGESEASAADESEKEAARHTARGPGGIAIDDAPAFDDLGDAAAVLGEELDLVAAGDDASSIHDV